MTSTARQAANDQIQTLIENWIEIQTQAFDRMTLTSELKKQLASRMLPKVLRLMDLRANGQLSTKESEK